MASGNNQNDRQAFARAISGTALSYEGDWHAAFTAQGIPDGGRSFNGRLLLWINFRLGTSYTELNGAMNAWAQSQGVASWNEWAGTGSSFVPLTGSSLDFYFANNQYFGGATTDLTVVRAGANATNLLPSDIAGFAYTTYAANTARIDTRGLLIEETRINNLLNSAVPVTQTTASLGTGTYVLWVNGSGSALASAGSATITGAASASNGSPNVFQVTVAGTVTVTVTGSLNAFQLELGAFGTSLIVTAGATGTRATDVVSLAGAAFTSVYGTTAGALYAEGIPIDNNGGSASRRFLEIDDNTTNNLLAVLSNTSGIGAGSVLNGGVVQATIPTVLLAVGQVNKIMLTYAVNDFNAACNGALGVQDTSGSLPTPNRMFFGLAAGAAATTVFNGYIRRVALWKTRQLDAFMQTTTDDGLIGGFTIGQTGTGVLSSFKLLWGDDFNTVPTRYTNINPTGTYSSNSPTSANRQSQGNGSDNAIYVEPAYRGDRSQSTSDLGYEPLSVAVSVLTQQGQDVPVGLEPYVPAIFNTGGDTAWLPWLYSGKMTTWPTFMISASGDFALDCYAQVAAGTINAYWPSFWTTAFNWPDYGEVDIVEVFGTPATTRFNNESLHVSNVDGGGDVVTNIVTARTVTTGRYVRFLVVKSGTTLTFYDDIAVAGTLASVGTYTDARVGRLRGGHTVNLELASNPLGGSNGTFNIAEWPKGWQIDWVRVWGPLASAANTATTIINTISTTPGGSWATTLPSTSSIFGGSVDLEEVFSCFDNFDTPGMPGSNKLPIGMSVNLGTRAVTGTVPTTEGGRSGILLVGSFTAGGPAKRAILYYNVSPAAQNSLMTDQQFITGDTVSKTIAYFDFHSGNLGPHTYSVSQVSGPAGLSIGGNGTGTVTITGTAPVGTLVFNISCTNSVGQTTTVSRTLTVGASRDNGVQLFNAASGGIPAGWSTKWVTTNVTWVENAGGFLRAATTLDGRHALSFDTPGTATDIRLLGLMRTNLAPGVSMIGPRLVARGSGAAAAENGYTAGFSYDASSVPFFSIGKYLAGVQSFLVAAPPIPVFANTYWWFRLEVIGTGPVTVRGKYWPTNRPEPNAWFFEGVDASSPITTAGWFGCFVFSNAQNADWDQFGYSTSTTAPSS